MALIEEQNPLTNFIYALGARNKKAVATEIKQSLLDFLQVEGTLEQQAKIFVIQAREQPERVQDKLMQFFSSQVDRADTQRNIGDNHSELL